MFYSAKRKEPVSHQVIIIGGGVIGLSCALSLQMQGSQCLVLESEADPRGASWGNAGHIAIEQAEPIASPATIRSFPKRLFCRGGAVALPPGGMIYWLPFAWRLWRAARPRRFAAGKIALKSLLAAAMPAWRRLVAAAGAPDLLREDGHFVVWETPATAAAGRAAWAAADTGEARFRDATPQEIAALSGVMADPPAGAIRFQGTGRIADPLRLAEALRAAFVAAGGTMRQARVADLPLLDGAALVRLENGVVLTADLVVVAAGIASGRLLAPLGHTVPMIAERGYHIQSAESDWPLDLPPIVFEDRSMIVTRFESGLRAASFVEFTRAASPPDPRKWARLRAHAAALGLSLDMAKDWIGSRPTLPDYLPAIGRSDRASNLLYAFGHNHLGLTLAAVTGEMVAGLAAGTPAPPALSLDRFQRNRA